MDINLTSLDEHRLIAESYYRPLGDEVGLFTAAMPRACR